MAIQNGSDWASPLNTSPIRRGTIEVPVGYAIELESAIKTTRETAQNASSVPDEPPVTVLVSELKQDDINLEARFWTDSRRTVFVLSASNVRAAVVKAFKNAGIGLPDPAVRIIVSR